MSDSEESTSSKASSDSMEKNPETSMRYYMHLYKRVLTKMFVSLSKKPASYQPPGMNHQAFLANLKMIKENPTVNEGNMPLIYNHIICNQYVRAANEPTAPWEKNPMMKELYDLGVLKRWSGKMVAKPSQDDPPPSPGPQDIMDNTTSDRLMDSMDDVDISDTEDATDNVVDPPGITVESILQDLKINLLYDVRKKAEAVTQRLWMSMKKTQVPESKRNPEKYKVYIYPDSEETKMFIKGAVKTAVLKIAQSAQKRGRDNMLSDEFADRPVKVVRTEVQPIAQTIPLNIPQSAPSQPYSSGNDVSQYLNAFLPHDQKQDRSDGQVFWGDILQSVDMASVYLPSDNIVDMEKNIKMSCGAAYVKQFPTNPQKNPLTGRRTYGEEHRDKMMAVAHNIKTALQKRKQAAGL